jgi:hypothetical protein
MARLSKITKTPVLVEIESENTRLNPRARGTLLSSFGGDKDPNHAKKKIEEAVTVTGDGQYGSVNQTTTNSGSPMTKSRNTRNYGGAPCGVISRTEFQVANFPTLHCTLGGSASFVELSRTS